MKEPIGIDERPVFSWVLTSGRQKVVQVQYRIRVQKADGQFCWDSGEVESSSNTCIVYEGRPLESAAAYIWDVEVIDNYGRRASGRASFETAMLQKEDWKARWAESTIPVSDRKDGFGNQPPATMFRHRFAVRKDSPVAAARLYCTARGVYKLYLNGEETAGSVLAPGYAAYDRIFPYQTYNVTALLHTGDNVLGMYVGDGWYFNQETAIHKGETASGQHSVLFQLHIRYQDGTEEAVYSDGTEKTAHGPVQFSDLFAGERYDARLAQEGWSTADYDDTGWTPVRLAEGTDTSLKASPDDCIAAVSELPVQRLFEAPNGDLLADFGQNMAGRVRVRAALPAGVKMALEHFEVTDRENNYFNTIYMTNGVGAGADQKAEYVADGGESVYEPLFTYFGFRYVRIRFFDPEGNELSGDQRPNIAAQDLTAIALSTRKEELGTFACSDERLNRLYQNIRWSQRSNMLSIPTDCPQREKAGWTGDAGIYIGTALLNEEVTPLFTRWLKSVEADQQEDGSVPMVVPFNETYRNMSQMMSQMTGMKGHVSPAGWGDACVKIPWTMYQVTGNRRILQSSYRMMQRWCDYVIRSAEICGRPDLPQEKERYLWDSGFHYGEWLIPSTSRGGFADQEATGMAMALTARYIAPIFGYISVSTFAQAAEILGREEDKVRYAQIAERMKDAIETCLIDPNGEAPAEYMGAYVLLLYYDLVPAQFRAQYENRLLQMIRENDGCLDTGFLATPYLLETLEKTGHVKEAYDLLFQTKSPSWLYEVEHSATTIWETWNAVDEKGNPQHVSMNHYSFGCVADWMFRVIGGIGSAAPGYRQIVIAPNPDDRLTWARRTYMSEQGEIVCAWKKTGDRFEMNVQVPCNTEALILLPDGTKASVGSGQHSYSIYIES